jgi:Fe2+ or Zn2+ uptake regulation protein
MAARESDPRLNLSTVYRTLSWLSEQGLVNPQRFEGHQRHERFDVSSAAEHHHFVCSSCGRVIEFAEPLLASIQSDWEKRLRVYVAGATLVLRGQCQACLREREREDAQGL